MKYASFLLIAFFCISCSSKNDPKQTILTPNNLPAQLFEIDPSGINNIITKNGAIISFPANAFKLNGAGKVTVEIKEAYSMKDILLGGLITESNGRQLSSGGMIYLNAQQNGKNVELQKKAGVSIPTSSYAEGMQLFKGEVAKDSTINWVEPKPLDSTPARIIEAGKQLFMQNCASCHGIDKPSTGPALYDMLNRAPSKAWLNKFIRNWEEAYHHTDKTGFNYNAYTCCAVAYNRSQNMNKFAALSDESLDALYAYTQYYAEQNPRRLVPDESAKCRPCLDMPGIETLTTEYWDTTIVTETMQLLVPVYPSPEVDKNQILTGSMKYVFSIDALGWYNVDLLYKDVLGTVNGTLSASITGKYNEELNVYFAVPARKIFSRSFGLKNGSWIFGFEQKDSLPLYPGDRAYIIAFGELDNRMIYGIKPFFVQPDNQLSLTLSGITEEAFINHIRSLGLDGLGVSFFKEGKTTQVIAGKPEDFYASPPSTNTQDDTGQQPVTRPARQVTVETRRDTTVSHFRQEYRYEYNDHPVKGKCPCEAAPMPAADTARGVGETPTGYTPNLFPR